jgi:hypothetical protein
LVSRCATDMGRCTIARMRQGSTRCMGTARGQSRAVKRSKAPPFALVIKRFLSLGKEGVSS